MVKRILCILLISCTTATFANSLIGKYNCKGHDPLYQHHYTGTLTISANPNSPKTYLFQEAFNDLDFQKNVGIGYLYHNNFITVFQDPSYGVGMTVYTVKNNGDLSNGKFFYYSHSNKGVGDESCTKISSNISGA